MVKLSQAEKETLILFNEAERTAVIQTYNRRWKTRLHELAKTDSDMFRIVEIDGEREVFECDKCRLALPRRRPVLSEEQREKLADNLKTSKGKPDKPTKTQIQA